MKGTFTIIPTELFLEKVLNFFVEIYHLLIEDVAPVFGGFNHQSLRIRTSFFTCLKGCDCCVFLLPRGY